MKIVLLISLAALLSGCNPDGSVNAEAVRAGTEAAQTGFRDYQEIKHPGTYYPPVVNPQTGRPAGYP